MEQGESSGHGSGMYARYMAWQNVGKGGLLWGTSGSAEATHNVGHLPSINPA